MTRFQAAGVHLLLSAFIVFCVLAIMLGVWYPGVYFKLMGGGGILFIMAGVDICLGPLLTLVVFKSGKKSLKMDLILIGLLQAAALTYGSWVMFEARPVFTVFTKDQFRIASTVDIEPTELAKAKRPEWQNFSLVGPVLVAAIPPNNRQEMQDLTFLATAGVDWHQLPRLYVDYSEQRNDVLKVAKPISELRIIDLKNGKVIDKFMRARSETGQNFVFVPVRTSHAEMAAILDAKSGELIEIIDAKPWK